MIIPRVLISLGDSLLSSVVDDLIAMPTHLLDDLGGVDLYPQQDLHLFLYLPVCMYRKSFTGTLVQHLASIIDRLDAID